MLKLVLAVWSITTHSISTYIFYANWYYSCEVFMYNQPEGMRLRFILDVTFNVLSCDGEKRFCQFLFLGDGGC